MDIGPTPNLGSPSRGQRVKGFELKKLSLNGYMGSFERLVAGNI